MYSSQFVGWKSEPMVPAWLGYSLSTFPYVLTWQEEGGEKLIPFVYFLKTPLPNTVSLR
jgi:hypothetical protein